MDLYSISQKTYPVSESWSSIAWIAAVITQLYLSIMKRRATRLALSF